MSTESLLCPPMSTKRGVKNPDAVLSGILIRSSSATSPTVKDFTVVQDFNKDHKLKANAAEESAQVKNRKYLSAYLRERNMTFIPLVVTSVIMPGAYSS